MGREGCFLALSLFFGSVLTGCAYSPDLGAPAPYHYDYYYYPHVDVYFHHYSGYYYYRDGRTWTRAQVLPRHLYLDHRSRKTIVIRDEHPYTRHREHRNRYREMPEFKPNRRYDPPERDHNRRTFGKYRKQRH